MSDRPIWRQSGQALIETALLIPLLLALWLGLISVLRIAHAKVTMLQAARYGAAVEAASGEGEKAARAYLSDELRGAQVVVDGVRVDRDWPLAKVVIEGKVMSPVPGQNPLSVRVSAGIGTRIVR